MIRIIIVATLLLASCNLTKATTEEIEDENIREFLVEREGSEAYAQVWARRYCLESSALGTVSGRCSRDDLLLHVEVEYTEWLKKKEENKK